MDAAEMLSDLGDYGFSDTSTTTKVRALQKAVWAIEGSEPWPFLEAEDDANFSGTSGVPSNWTTDFTRCRTILRVKDLSTGARIRPLRMDDFEDRVGKDYTTAGDPLVYWFQNREPNFYPLPPSSTARVRIRFIQRSAAITASSTEAAFLIPVQYHEVIIARTLPILYAMEDDIELAQYFAANAVELQARMKSDIFVQQYDMPDFVHVFDSDDPDDDYL